MTVEPQGIKQRTSRSRIVAALCTAGIVAVSLSGNLLGAGAQDEPPVPGEPVIAAPTMAAPDAGAAAASVEQPATTGADPTTSTVPADGAEATPTTTETSPEQPPATTATTAPAPQPAPAAPAPAAPAAPVVPAPPQPAPAKAPLPIGEFASAPATERPGARPCAAAARAPAGTAFAEDGGGLAGSAGATPACERRGPTKTDVSDRGAVSRTRTDAPRGDAQRTATGVPTVANPTTSLALPGAVPVGVPNFFIDKFRIPPFLLPIYQAAGIQYGVRWEVLAAINEIETDYGRNLNISSAGALGWMQFMPATWRAYGTDANRDGRRDPFNPVDAIFAAARYLKAAGADHDLRRAIFAYNHADWYVESVLMRARLIGGLPSDLVGSLSGLTQGHFPVFARARYADDLSERRVLRRVAAGQNAAQPIESSATRRGIDIFAKAGSPAIAVQDGTITAIGTSRRLGRYVQLRDVYGNTYTYAHLRKVAAQVPVPKPKTQSRASIARELELPKRDARPTRPASAGRPTSRRADVGAPANPVELPAGGVRTERLFAHPARSASLPHGGSQQILEAELSLEAGATLKSYFTGVYGLDPDDVVLKPLIVGRRVIAGTILGRIGQTDERIAPRLHFEIRPAGRGAPRIDPKPILDGWKLLESTAIYRARGKNPLLGPDASRASIGQIMLMSKDALSQRVLANPRIEVYSCGRRDIEAGIIDRRVLATLEFLAASGLKPTVTSLTCGHGYYTSSGNVSAHSSGNAIDIAKINGIPILGHQGEGSITDITIRRLLTLQGTIKPNQIISLMRYDGTDNTLAMGDHADHIHVGFQPAFQPGTRASSQLEAVLKPAQWIKLIERLGRIDNPTVSAKPSKYAITVPVKRASVPHRGE